MTTTPAPRTTTHTRSTPHSTRTSTGPPQAPATTCTVSIHKTPVPLPLHSNRYVITLRTRIRPLDHPLTNEPNLQSLSHQPYNDHAVQAPSGSSHWAYQGGQASSPGYDHLAQPGSHWMTEQQRGLQLALTKDAQSSSYADMQHHHYHHHLDTLSDSTGSISPMSDTSVDSLPLAPLPASSSSSIANWNVLPPHQYQHHAMSGGHPDPCEAHTHSQNLVSSPIEEMAHQHHHEVEHDQAVEPVRYASPEHRRSRYTTADSAPLPPQLHQDPREQSAFYEVRSLVYLECSRWRVEVTRPCPTILNSTALPCISASRRVVAVFQGHLSY